MDHLNMSESGQKGENGMRSNNSASKLTAQRHQPRQSPFGPLPVICAFYVAVASLVHWRLQATPQPLGLDATAEHFSEARALRHVAELTAGGEGRLVSHPSIDAGTRYVLDAAQEIASLARRRSDLHAQVELQRVDGAIHMLFLENTIGNAYQNLSNIVVTITPAELGSEKGVLVASHLDSLIGSPGASDCASQVAVMLETARALVTDRNVKLVAPIVFLFNGGEETFSQAAHGFMQRNDRPLGVFVNLESTGPGGPDYLFQQTGGWPAAAYARSAKHPRGAVIGQDIFESGLLPADSDYRMFSWKHYGTLPGLDIAFLLDGAAYHTDRDTVERLRPGTLQAMGDNMLAAVPELAIALAQQSAHSNDTKADANGVYFDIFGSYMVVYSHKLAKMLHSIPVALALAMPLMSGGGWRSSQVPTFSAILKGGAIYTGSFLAAILAPAALGMLRVLMLGNPMVWYAHHWTAFAMFMPVSVAAAVGVQAWGQRAAQLDLANALLGVALALGGLASIMTSLHLGSSFLFAAWALAALLGMPAAGRELQTRSLGTALAAAFMPIVLSLPVAFLLANILIDKSSMIGVLPPPLGPAAVDAIIGAVIGLSVALCLGAVTPWLASLLPRLRLKALCSLMLVMGVSVAAVTSIAQQPYSVAAPKRILLQHLFVQGSDGNVTAQKLVIGGSDVNRVQDTLDVSNLKQLPQAPQDWQTLYPLTSRLGGIVVEPPEPSPPPLDTLPSIRVVRMEAGEGGARRAHLRLHTGAPCWGVMLMDGPIAAWSFAEGLPHSDIGTDGAQHAVRIAGNAGSEQWDFWVDLHTQDNNTQRLHIELTVTLWQQSTPALAKFAAQLPPWTTLLMGVTFQSDWRFSDL